MLDYLQSTGEKYTYQAELYGGFRPGGVVPDFVVSRSGNGLALLINGTYWHRPNGPQNDAADKLRIVGQYFNGDLITQAVIVWESRLMASDRRATMQAALSGQELPSLRPNQPIQHLRLLLTGKRRQENQDAMGRPPHSHRHKTCF